MFRTHSVPTGGRVHKRVILDDIKAAGMDMNDVRSAWHELMGTGLIRQLGDELELTDRGGRTLYDPGS